MQNAFYFLIVDKQFIKMKRFVALLLACCWYMGIFAQISNASMPRDISRQASARSSKSKISSNVTFGANSQTGNTEKSGVFTTASFASVDSIKEFSANLRYAFGANNRVVNQREYLAGGQCDYRPLSRLSPFVRFEFYNNTFRQIAQRYSGLAGLKYRYFVYKRSSDYSISAALLFHYEKYTSETDLPDTGKMRLSIRPKFKQNLMENIHLLAEVYYKPNLADFDDYMIYSITTFNFKVNRQIFLRASYEYEYNSRPATAAVKKTDTLLLGSFGVEF